MRSHLLIGLVCIALGILGGALGYKRLHPAVPCPEARTESKATETRTIIRTVTKEGKPIEKEVVVREEVATETKTPPSPRPKNLIGVTGRLAPDGTHKVGPTYGRELFPNTYVTGSVLVSPKGKPAPEVVVGVQLLF